MDKRWWGILVLFLLGCTLQNNLAGLVLGEHEQSKPVQKGWNFFSAPVSGTLSSTVDIALYEYNGQWQIKSDRALVGGKAYWVDAAAPGEISLTNVVPVSSVAVAQGVNAFGIPSLNPLRHTQLRLGATSLADYILYAWDGTTFQLVASDTQLEPATGYVLMNAPMGNLLFDLDEDGFDAAHDCLDNDANTKPGSPIPCYEGPAGKGGIGECNLGSQTCQADATWGSCIGYGVPADEMCNNKDDDCNNNPDDGIADKEYYPSDQDPTKIGVGVCARGRETCTQGTWQVQRAAVTPSTEVCGNRGDEDCDGTVALCADGTACTEYDQCASQHCVSSVCCFTAGADYYYDGEGDGYGTGNPNVLCQPNPATKYTATQGGDCDDTNGNVKPGTLEVCGDGLDNDCVGGDTVCTGTVSISTTAGVAITEGTTDLGATDTSGGKTLTLQVGSHTLMFTKAGGYTPVTRTVNVQTDQTTSDSFTYCTDADGDLYGVGDGCLGTDCLDTNADVKPGAAETCNDADDDCDGTKDNIAPAQLPANDLTTGVCANTKKRCDSAAKAFVNNYPTTYQSTEALCDDLDNDCDGTTDNIAPAQLPANDLTTGVCANTKKRCDSATKQFVNNYPTTYRSADTLCDGLDNDCDGQTDEAADNPCNDNTKRCESGGCVPLCVDEDGDGYGASGTGCPNQGIDCIDSLNDPLAANIHPAATETCNGIDDDCDGTADEDNSCGPVTLSLDSPQMKASMIILELCNGRDDDGNGAIDNGLDANTCACANGAVQAASQSETCNGKDDDCDGAVDEELTGASCYLGAPGTEGKGECKAGKTMCINGQWKGCVGEQLPVTEVCDGKDNDCDEATDEGNICPQAETCNGVDDDGDGKVDENDASYYLYMHRLCPGITPTRAANGDCLVGFQKCTTGQWVNDWTKSDGSCGISTVPKQGSFWPLETCDEVDNNCNGLIDDHCINYRTRLQLVSTQLQRGQTLVVRG